MNNRHFLSLGAIALAALLTGGPLKAGTDDHVHLHGFVSQAMLYSTGNNYYGKSRDGSTDFMEAGLYGHYRLTPKSFLSAQITTRDAGTTDNGSVELDYLFADIKALENSSSDLGLRIGRVRNSYGLYNDTRDVLFTRPSILMPQAIYFEGNGLREILFASDGAQLYSYWDKDNNSTSLTMTYGLNRDIEDKVLKNLLGPSADLVNDASVDSPIFVKLLHSQDGGRRRFAVSLLDLSINLDTVLPQSPSVDLVANSLVVSGQLNLSRWSFTSEAAYTSVEYRGIQDGEDSDISSAYLQTQYRLLPELSMFSRYEYSMSDLQESGSSSTEHWVVGGQWTPTPSWIISADYYYMRGTSGVPMEDNAGRQLDSRTQVFAIMVGYRF